MVRFSFFESHFNFKISIEEHFCLLNKAVIYSKFGGSCRLPLPPHVVLLGTLGWQNLYSTILVCEFVSRQLLASRHSRCTASLVAIMGRVSVHIMNESLRFALPLAQLLVSTSCRGKHVLGFSVGTCWPSRSVLKWTGTAEGPKWTGPGLWWRFGLWEDLLTLYTT